jgi:phosphoribosyl 1,2-cyclic phosphodiesterase
LSIELCVLASGSGGNSTLVRAGGRAVLVDAGFGPRATARRLAGTGVGVDDLRAIVLTHLDRDHFAPTWFGTCRDRGIHLYVAERHVAALYAALRRQGGDGSLLHRLGLVHAINGRPVSLAADTGVDAELHPVHLAHDRAGTVGYVIHTPRHRLGYATDLGRVTDALLDALTDVHLLAIESNYDRAMELTSARPDRLKRRIMSGRGHLSNDQAFEAVCRIVDRSHQPPDHVLLLHLSRRCNCPRLVRRLYDRRPDIARRLCLTSPSQPTGWLGLAPRTQARAGEQLGMFG